MSTIGNIGIRDPFGKGGIKSPTGEVSTESDFGKDGSQALGEGRTFNGEAKVTGDGQGFEVQNQEQTTDGKTKTTITYYDNNGNHRVNANVGAGDENKTDVNGQRSWTA